MKTYIKPTIQMRMIQVHPIMDGSNVFSLNNGNGEGPDLSNARRGTWGNLWDDGDSDEE